MTHGPSPMSGSCQQLLLRHKGWEVFDANVWEALSSWLWQDGVLKDTFARHHSVRKPMRRLGWLEIPIRYFWMVCLDLWHII